MHSIKNGQIFGKRAFLSLLLLLFTAAFCGKSLYASGKKDAARPGLSAGSVERSGDGEASLYWRLAEENGGVFVIDGAGNKVPLSVYSRIVVISPGAVETMYMTGGEAAIAGLTSGRDPIWPEEKTALLPDVGNTARPNIEAIIALKPDLVIGNAMTAALMADLASRGYTVLLHNADSIADVFNSAIILGQFTGREAEARLLVAEKQAELDRIKVELRANPLNLKGAFLYSASPIMAFTAESLPGEILGTLGAENIAAGLNAAQPILSPEYILAQNPDFLFGAMSITKPGDILAADSVIAKTRAGKEGNIRIIPSSLFLRPSPRIVENLLEMYRELRNMQEREDGK
ncbi:MAG: ABC transporter substrate-binding protein [Spirochaetaceae bacterium]|jgi:iron complex transport system substrate-binding protein|nr:ABC transporter substrate-binding protein [Spirochaetaceae bacterium]